MYRQTAKKHATLRHLVIMLALAQSALLTGQWNYLWTLTMRTDKAEITGSHTDRLNIQLSPHNEQPKPLHTTELTTQQSYWRETYNRTSTELVKYLSNSPLSSHLSYPQNTLQSLPLLTVHCVVSLYPCQMLRTIRKMSFTTLVTCTSYVFCFISKFQFWFWSSSKLS